MTVNVLAARPTGPLRVLRLRDSVALDTEPGGVPSPTLPPSSWAASRRVGRSCAMGGMGAMALSGMAFDRRCLPACHDGHCVVFRTPGAVLRRLTVSVRGLPHGRVAARSAATAGTAPDARSAPGALLSVDAAHAARHQLVSFHTSDDPGCRESSLHGRRVGRRVRHEQILNVQREHSPGPPQSVGDRVRWLTTCCVAGCGCGQAPARARAATARPCTSAMFPHSVSATLSRRSANNSPRRVTISNSSCT